jgi:hypothetical protein
VCGCNSKPTYTPASRARDSMSVQNGITTSPHW